MAIDQVKQLLAVQLPGPQPTGLFFVGSLACQGLSLFRKYRLYRNPVNVAELGVGHAINLAIGNKPGVKEIARFVFLAVSIVKCAEDIIQITEDFRSLKGHLTGKSYVWMRKDPMFHRKKWSILGPRFDASWLWFCHVGLERMRLSAWIIASIVGRTCSLAIHLGDAHAALTEDHVSAVVIHGHLLWKKLANNDAILVKKLQTMRRQTDAMLKVLNLPFTSETFFDVLKIPSEVNEKLPDMRDVRRGIISVLEGLRSSYNSSVQDAFNVHSSLRVSQTPLMKRELIATKIIKPPIRVVN